MKSTIPFILLALSLLLMDQELLMARPLPSRAPGKILVRLKDDVTIEQVMQKHKGKFTGRKRIHNISDTIAKHKKNTKVQRNSQGRYKLGKKSYQQLRDIPDEEWFKDAYQHMPAQKKKLFRSHSLQVTSQEAMDKTLAELNSDPDIEFAEPNYLGYASYIPPSNPQYNNQWAHTKSRAEQGWDIQRGTSSTVIAIVDTGVYYNHEDLANNIWRDGSGNPGRDLVDITTWLYELQGYTLLSGEDYEDDDSDPSDFNGHGTHCAGIAAAVDNDKGIIGSCPNAKIMPIRAGFSIETPSNGIGGVFEWDDVADAIRWATDNGADVISMSFSGGESSTLYDAISYAYNNGVVLVAAAGNNNNSSQSYPAAYSEVIAVGSTASDDTRSSFSTYGSWVTLSAPGSSILSTVPLSGALGDPSGYRYLQGTSMACPYVAGVAGLILSTAPSLTNAQVRAKLVAGVDAISTDQLLGSGRINIYRSLLDYADTSIYRSNYSKRITIAGFDNKMYELYNTDSRSYFVPNKSTLEWNAFKSAANSLSGLTLTEVN